MGRFRNRRMEKSKPESERDSGFSDAGSEHQTETDEARSRAQLTALVGGALPGLSPMIIMNNVVLKQSGQSAAPLKPWAFGRAVEVVPQPQVVFLQPVAPQRSVSLHKGASSKRRRHRKYLPILKSYPKIAPHPGDGLQKSSSASSSGYTSSSASSDAPTSDSAPSSTSSVRSSSSSHPEHKQKDVVLSTSSVPHESDTETPNASDNKVKRFCNTYNILRKSGLLDITLRTKELIRQNRRTQAELERLRLHTGLLTEALRTGEPALLSRLQSSLREESSTADGAVTRSLS